MGKIINIKLVLVNEHLKLDVFKQFEQLNIIQFETIRYQDQKTTMCLNYSSQKFYDILIKLLESSSEFAFEAYKTPCFYSIMRKEKICIFDISYKSELFLKKNKDIFLIIDKIFSHNLGIVGYICHGDDAFFQNTRDIENFKIVNKPYEHLKLIPSQFFTNDKAIDIEQNPGHSHFVNDLWFGSFWAMWFGKRYYQYIPENTVASFSDGYENFRLENGARRILLYEDIFSFDEPHSRIIQQKFREATGMDIVAHDLMNSNSLENKDPSIEILNGIFEHGGVKMMKRYIDSEYKTIKKSKAIKVEEREFSIDNNEWLTIWNGISDL